MVVVRTLVHSDGEGAVGSPVAGIHGATIVGREGGDPYLVGDSPVFGTCPDHMPVHPCHVTSCPEHTHVVLHLRLWLPVVSLI